MPSTTIVIDGLWRCLCPPSSTTPFSGFFSILRPAPRTPGQCLKAPLRGNHARNFSKKPPAAARSPAWKLYGSGQQQLAEKTVTFSGTQQRDQERMRKVDIGTAYQTLRHAALGGNYAQTGACANILVKERGEKPNLRLYDALLLANADHDYGSASEVTRLLEELASEGLTPDSGTYHAALRVRNTALTLCASTGSPFVGTCYTPRLPPAVPYPRGATPKMVSPEQRWMAQRGRWLGQRSPT